MTVLLLAALLLAPQIVRPPAPVRSGSGVIAGRVTEAASGQPLPRMTVRLNVDIRYAPVETQTDDDGRYQFRNLPDGSYGVWAGPPDTRRTHLGKLFVDPTQPTGPGQSRIPLRDGEVRRDINFVLPRSLAINGHVLTDAGDPVADITVTIAAVGSAESNLQSRQTDDRGAFRLFGLQPGRYRVCAEPRSAWPNTTADDAAERPLKTCYPGVLEQDTARAVEVTTAELDDIDIRLHRGRTYTIRGRVLDGSGTAAVRPTVGLRGARGGTSYTTDADGRFVFRGVLPGDYVVGAQSVPIWDDNPEREAATAVVRIESTDMTDVVIRMSKAMRIAGHVVLEGNEALPPLTKIGIQADGDLSTVSRPRQTLLKDDLTFELTQIFGPQRLSVQGLPRGWIVKAVRYNGRDIQDRRTEFKAGTDPAALEILLSPHPLIAEVSVTDPEGRPARGRVFAFPADPATWHERVLQRGGSGVDGVSRLPLRPGDFIILAVAPEQSPPFSDAKDFAAVAPYGTRLTVTESGPREISVKIARLPEPR